MRGISAGQRRESAERRVPLDGSLFRGAALEVPDDSLQGWPAASTLAFNGVRMPGEKTSLLIGHCQCQYLWCCRTPWQYQSCGRMARTQDIAQDMAIPRGHSAQVQYAWQSAVVWRMALCV